MARYSKVFTVRADQQGKLEVSHEGKLMYRLGGEWRKQLLEWQAQGWDILWTA
jgi:hypothetical protein